MLEEGKFGVFGAVCFTSIMIISKLFYTNIGQLVKITGTAAWQSSLVSCLVAMFFFHVMYLLIKRFPGKNLFQITEAVLGKTLMVLLGIAYIAYLIYYAGTNLREFVEMIKAYNLPYTPTSIIVGSVILTVILISYYGLECLTRISVIFFISMVAGIILIFTLASPHYDPTLLRPYMGYGLLNTLDTGFARSSGYGEIIRLMVIVASLQGINNFKKAGYLSLAISGTAFVLGTAFYVMAFGYPQGGENLAGIFELARGIYFNRFFQRIESVFLFMWVTSSIIAISGAYYIGISSFCKIFNIKNHYPLLLPFAILLFVITMQPKNLAEVIEINIKITRQYSYLGLFVIPLIILLIAILLGKKGTDGNENRS